MRYSPEIKIWNFSHLFTQNRLILCSLAPKSTCPIFNQCAALSSSLISPNCCFDMYCLYKIRYRRTRKARLSLNSRVTQETLNPLDWERSGAWEHTRQQCSVLIGEHSPGPGSQHKGTAGNTQLSPLDIPLSKRSALTLWKFLALIFKYQLHSWRWYLSC